MVMGADTSDDLHEMRHGLRELREERDALRAELAAVRAERDGHVNETRKRMREAAASQKLIHELSESLAAARAEVARLRRDAVLTSGNPEAEILEAEVMRFEASNTELRALLGEVLDWVSDDLDEPAPSSDLIARIGAALAPPTSSLEPTGTWLEHAAPPTAFGPPPVPLGLDAPPMTREQFREASERLSPSPRCEDDDDLAAPPTEPEDR